MSKYFIRKKYREIKSDEIWNSVVEFVNENRFFSSVSKKKKYNIWINGDSVFYKGGDKSSKRSIEGEIFKKEVFIQAFKDLKKMEYVNTNIIKDKIPKSLYRQRTPLIGLLFTMNVLKKND